MRRQAIAATSFLLALSLSPLQAKTYTGTCDASTGIALDSQHFLVADDETEQLRVYSNDPTRSGSALPYSIDFASELRDNPDREIDIEASAKLGSKLFFISSHGRNGKGKLRPNRYRFFAVEIQGSHSNLQLKLLGQSHNVLTDMLNANNWYSQSDTPTLVDQVIILLEQASQLDIKKQPSLAPKADGINIEAMSLYYRKQQPPQAEPDGLLIGFRNPTLAGSALIVPLLNPSEVVSTTPLPARFGTPSLVHLDGLGLRAMSYQASEQRYLLLAGPGQSGGPFKLFVWSGPESNEVTLLKTLDTLPGQHPEALLVYPSNDRFQILHDEGSRLTSNGKECKRSSTEQSFSDQWVELPKSKANDSRAD